MKKLLVQTQNGLIEGEKQISAAGSTGRCD